MPSETVLELVWELDHFERGGESFVPQTYEGDVGDVVPSGFNAVKIALDAGAKASLDWSEALNYAEACVDQGFLILWDIDLALERPLSDQLQFSAAALALGEFSKQCWQQHQSHTLGLILHRASASFSKDFVWTPQQQDAADSFSGDDPFLRALYCRDAWAQFLRLLLAKLPEDIPVFLGFDAKGVAPEQLAVLLSQEAFEHFHFIVKGVEGCGLPGLSWGFRPSSAGYLSPAILSVPTQEPILWGVCLPAPELVSASKLSGLRKAITSLQEQKIPFRFVPEAFIHAHWHGLDTLVADDATLSREGRRKLQGFQAAGGEILSFEWCKE